jgi:hypothetical protein
MRLRQFALLVLVAVAIPACGVTISALNARPQKYYEHKVTITGRIARTQLLSGATLLELVDAHGGRIIVRSADPVEQGVDDWVKVTGVLVAETHVGDAVLYDVVTAEHISGTRAPRFMNLM